MKFYHTAGRTFAGLIEEWRRQLQAHVRRRRSEKSLVGLAWRRSTIEPNDHDRDKAQDHNETAKEKEEDSRG